LKAEAVTLFKEDVLALGQLVSRTVAETARMLRKEKGADLGLIEEQEESINKLYQQIEENCFELLMEKDIRLLLGSTIIAAKFERMADHSNRVAKIASWAREDNIDLPPELSLMADCIHKMVQDVLFSFVTDQAEKVAEILHRDSEIDYLDAVLSKRLLSNLGDQEQEKAQISAQFLFCTRYLERMGDLTKSVAKRIYFISTGKRLKSVNSEIASN
jgi:phosphate transport system protein